MSGFASESLVFQGVVTDRQFVFIQSWNHGSRRYEYSINTHLSITYVKSNLLQVLTNYNLIYFNKDQDTHCKNVHFNRSNDTFHCLVMYQFFGHNEKDIPVNSLQYTLQLYYMYYG